jgi:MFS family permease
MPFLKDFGPLLLSTLAVMIAQGIAGILLPLRAGEAGWTATTVGWMGSAYAIGFTLACFVLPRLVMRVGHVRVYAAVVTLLSASMILHALIMHPVAWALIRGLGGFALAGCYMIVESWLSEKSDNANRGQIFSIYMLINFAGMIIGQFTMSSGPAIGITMFLIAALVFSASVFPVSLSPAQSPRPLTEASLSLGKLFANSPMAFVGSFIAGLISGNWNFLAPVFGSAIGLPTLAIATMMASAMVGGIVFQYPLGRASDLMDRRYVMIAAGVIGVLTSLGIIVIPHEPWLVFGAMFLFGAVLFPIYSLNVAYANDYAAPADFVKVSSGLLVIYGFGNMVGPIVGGRSMDLFGPQGFFVVMAVAYSAYGGYALWRIFRRTAIAPADRADFRPASISQTPTPQSLELDARADPEIAAGSEQESDRNKVWGYEIG